MILKEEITPMNMNRPQEHYESFLQERPINQTPNDELADYMSDEVSYMADTEEINEDFMNSEKKEKDRRRSDDVNRTKIEHNSSSNRHIR